MVPDHIAIIGGDHTPPLPFVIVNRTGMHVDIDAIDGQLWDSQTVASVHWGAQAPGGARFGTVRLKNGTSRTFWDGELMLPYLKAWQVAKGKHDAAIALARLPVVESPPLVPAMSDVVIGA
jgi:hypothetical protein